MHSSCGKFSYDYYFNQNERDFKDLNFPIFNLVSTNYKFDENQTSFFIFYQKSVRLILIFNEGCFVYGCLFF